MTSPTARLMKRIGVCLSADSDNVRLIEAAHNMAVHEKCEWVALFVEEEAVTLDPVTRQHIERAMEQAEALGAHSIYFPSTDAVQGAMAVCDLHGITDIVIGQQRKSRWRRLWDPTLAASLLRQNTGFELHIITIDDTQRLIPTRGIHNYTGYGLSILMVLALTVCVEIVQESLPDYRFNASIYNVSMLYLLLIVYCAMRFGWRPAMLASIVSFALYNYFFIPPFYTFGLGQFSDALNFILFLSASVVSVSIASRYTHYVRGLKDREVMARTLYELNKDIAGSGNLSEVVASLGTHLQEITDNDIILAVDDESAVSYPDNQALRSEHAHIISGVGTTGQAVLREEWHYYPMATSRKHIGVMGVKTSDTMLPKALLEVLCYQAALAIERAQLMKEAEAARLDHQRESLRSALLSSISHDLKTPLVSIIGGLSSLRSMKVQMDESAQMSLITGALEEAERLNQSITNILDMTCLEAGTVTLNKQWYEVATLYEESTAAVHSILQHHTVLIEPVDPPFMVCVDAVLVSKLLCNLLENAAKYTPEETVITLSAEIKSDHATFRITDEGAGIMQEKHDQLFDKFTRLEAHDSQTGTGLGLSICKAIVELHGGDMTVSNRSDRSGLQVTITLPDVQLMNTRDGDAA